MRIVQEILIDEILILRLVTANFLFWGAAVDKSSPISVVDYSDIIDYTGSVDHDGHELCSPKLSGSRSTNHEPRKSQETNMRN